VGNFFVKAKTQTKFSFAKGKKNFYSQREKKKKIFSKGKISFFSAGCTCT
jgi:hypothetical protein